MPGAQQSTSTVVARSASDEMAASDQANASNVVKFYDSVARSETANSLAHRQQTRIYHLRNFNNWIKSVFINEYTDKLRHDTPAHVLDLCCGKGGDQLKWAQSNVKHVTFVDISSASIDTCQKRYEQMCRKRYRAPYTADFHVADCTTDLTQEKWFRPGHYDLVSCQFSFHYAFESLKQARSFVANVNFCLRSGGYFIATIPNAYELVRRAHEARAASTSNTTNGAPDNRDLTQSSDIVFGNPIYSVRFPTTSFYPVSSTCSNDGRTVDTIKFPLFGACYDFHLEGVVDCPEFLVYPPLLNQLATEQDLVPVTNPEGFASYFRRVHLSHFGRESCRSLLIRMSALETWPQSDNDGLHTGERHSLVGNGEPGAYDHVHRCIDRDELLKQSRALGTLSLAEWEVVTLYSLVAFQKK